MSTRKAASEILTQIANEKDVRNYLRGLETGSEADEDAKRAMLASIEEMQAGGVPDGAAKTAPHLYAQGALLLCQINTDADAGDIEKLERRLNGIVLQLRHDPDAKKETEVN